jgi:hypothetical protein
MKTLRLLNIASFLLLFTPFFQMCSDDSAEDISIDGDKRSLTADSLGFHSVDRLQTQGGGQGQGEAEEEQSALEAFWDLITVPGDNFTTTAFGLFVITAFDLIEGNFSDIWIGSLLIIMSLILTCATLILLLKRRLERIVRLLLINLVVISASFGAALLKFDSISQVKWGFYLYLAITVLLFMQARATIPRAFPASATVR